MSESGANLHPRPRVTRAEWVDLNGRWAFAYDDADVGIGERWQDDVVRFNRQIIVPFAPESGLSGIGDTSFHPVLWYRRSFAAPAVSGRLLLHFGAVDYRASIWVNGDLVATHEGGHTPFTADITASLKPGAEQIVVVRAEDQPRDMTQPRGKQDWEAKPHAIWYNRTSGIWQTVWLEPVPETYIADLQLTPELADGSVKVEATLNRLFSGLLEVCLVARGVVLAEQRVRVEGGDRFETRVAVPAAQNGVHRNDLYWTPDNPNLIDVTVGLLDGDAKPVDSVESYFGLRSVGIGNGRFLLNDRPVFVRSVLEQGYWPKSHLTAPNAEALKREVELIKSLGFNAVRIHQKIEDPRFLYWADHLGLMVWGEIANTFEYNAQAVDRLTREWLSAVKRDRSHPSIVTWVPINESWGVSDIAMRRDQQDFATALYYLTKAIDPTRPVISNEGWEHTISDIWGIHDYTQFKEHLAERYGTKESIALTLKEMRPTRKRLLLRPEDTRGQPVMLTEFGGLSMHPKNGQPWFGYATAESQDEYLAMIKSLFDAIYDSTDLAGFCYTQITDTLQETNGLFDENRNPKLPVDKLRDIVMRPSNAVPSEALDIARQKALRVSFGQVA